MVHESRSRRHAGSRRAQLQGVLDVFDDYCEVGRVIPPCGASMEPVFESQQEGLSDSQDEKDVYSSIFGIYSSRGTDVVRLVGV